MRYLVGANSQVLKSLQKVMVIALFKKLFYFVARVFFLIETCIQFSETFCKKINFPSFQATANKGLLVSAQKFEVLILA